MRSYLILNKITKDNYHQIHEYSTKRKEHLQYWHDQGWLINTVRYFYEIKDGVLYIYRDIPYNKKAFFLAIPPMTLDNDYEKEYNALVSVLDKMSVRVSDEHLELYKDFGIKDFQIHYVQTEYLYNTADYRKENLTGKKGSHYRNAINWFEKNGYEWWVFDSKDVIDLKDIMKKIVKEWKIDTEHKDGSAMYHINSLEHLIDSKVMILSAPDQNVGFIISQKIGNTVMWSSEKFYFVYHRQKKAIVCKLAEIWRNELGYDMYMNKGAAINKQKQAKQSLKHSELNIWKILNG